MVIIERKTSRLGYELTYLSTSQRYLVRGTEKVTKKLNNVLTVADFNKAYTVYSQSIHSVARPTAEELLLKNADSTSNRSCRRDKDKD